MSKTPLITAKPYLHKKRAMPWEVLCTDLRIGCMTP